MLHKALTDYLKSPASRGRHSAKSIESYGRDLIPWITFLEEKYAELPSATRERTTFFMERNVG